MKPPAQSYLVGGGATGALVGGAFFFLISFSAVVSFSDWPDGFSGPSSATIDIGAPPESGGATSSPSGPDSPTTVRLGGAPRGGDRAGTALGISAFGAGGTGGAGALTGSAPAAGGGGAGGPGGRPGSGGGQGGQPGSGGGSAGAPAPGGSDAVSPGQGGTPPGQGGTPPDESAPTPAVSVPTAGNSSKVPPGQAKKHLESESESSAGASTDIGATAGNSGKVPPGQAKNQD